MRRRIASIIGLLIAGAVINLVVAWGLAIAHPLPEFVFAQTSAISGASRDVEPYWHTGVLARLGSLWVARTNIRRGRPAELGVIADEVPSWSAVHVPPDDMRNRDFPLTTHNEVAHGWPLLSLRYSFTYSREYPGNRRVFLDNIAGGWLLSGESTTTYSRQQLLFEDLLIVPLTPIVVGFSINTGLYAALLGAMIFGPLGLLRHRRAAKGLCPYCTYDLSHSKAGVCPECGRQTPERRRVKG